MVKPYLFAFALCFSISASAQWTTLPNGDIYSTNLGVKVGIGTDAPIDKLHVHGSTFVLGHIRMGQQKEDVGLGSLLIFNDHGNSDPLWMARYNVAQNVSELRVNIGDDGDDYDKFVIGYTENQGNWLPKFTFFSNGKLNINGTTRSGATNNVSFATQSDLGVSIQQANINNDFVNSNNYLSIYAHNMHHNGTGWIRRNQYSSGWATVLNHGYYEILYASDNQSDPAFTSVTPTSVLRIGTNGNVGIGTTNPGGFKLAVEGKIASREIRVTVQSPFPDYVFNKDYNLMSLASLEAFIEKNKHLPNVPSAQEVKENGGIELGDMNVKLLEKIEELTLHMIEMNKRMQLLEKENESLKKKVDDLSSPTSK